MLCIAECYYDGDGVPQNYQEAFKWCHKAAESGYANAQKGLGDLYEKGLGVVQNKKEAIKWYRKAAEQGHEEAKRLCADRINFKTKRKEYKCFVKNVAVN